MESVDHDNATALQLASWRGQGECVKVMGGKREGTPCSHLIIVSAYVHKVSREAQVPPTDAPPSPGLLISLSGLAEEGGADGEAE